ncbi:IclR family transcriptional regulator [Acidaminococcus massiliensis]|uniref:IclR family transcriptional regulator n=1 Tax=Acidaminococcus massiliensis TaxID=1852375 RepID=UPI00248D57C8|nr:IclR family transcriptional regulator [Acidaminococcus massiliensis]
MEQKPKYVSGNKSVSKTLAILSLFSEGERMLRTSEIAERLQMNISTVSRHLNTLLDGGFLQRDDATGYYYPGMEIITLAGVALKNKSIYRHAYPELQQLSFNMKVLSHLGIPDGLDVVHLVCCCCEDKTELLFPLGHRQPLYCSAMGRAMLAFLPEEEALRILKASDLQKYTPETQTDLRGLMETLKIIRKKGYCANNNQLHMGRGSIAAPVFDWTRRPVGAISISTQSHRLLAQVDEERFARTVTLVAGKISGKLGYYPA